MFKANTEPLDSQTGSLQHVLVRQVLVLARLQIHCLLL